MGGWMTTGSWVTIFDVFSYLNYFTYKVCFGVHGGIMRGSRMRHSKQNEKRNLSPQIGALSMRINLEALLAL